MSRFLLLLMMLLNGALVMSQQAKPYQIYNSRGKPITFKKMIKKLAKNDVILFGENHNDAIIHWLELRTLKALYNDKGKDLIIGTEMFERDTQEFIDAFLKDSIAVKELESQSRPWPNFRTDYLPLLAFAKEKELPFIATNVPRPYASVVAHEASGLDTLEQLSNNEKRWMAKLPVDFDWETPGYRKMEEMMKDHAGSNAVNYVKAQALKDATMAESILGHSKPGNLFIHFNGDFHSREHGGIYWYLKRKNEGLKVAVISIRESNKEDLPLKVEGKPTEFMIVVPEDMTKTY